MALSNFFREPRREITETVVGLVILIPAFWVAHQVALTMLADLGRHPNVWDLLIAHLFGSVLAAVGTMIAVFGIMGIHTLGESLCNGLAKRGLELRPKVRR